MQFPGHDQTTWFGQTGGDIEQALDLCGLTLNGDLVLNVLMYFSTGFVERGEKKVGVYSEILQILVK
ncbi:hypothetical protein CFP56_038729 [Quercus suber]|uniref:Uncharacterized protein n=1 Tax=Quercus suber TaxID=58331 RepID=A0AAW0J1K8_QUESU